MSSGNLDTVLGVNLKGVWYCERAQVGVEISNFLLTHRLTWFF
jgi:hypothetical protein